MTDVTGALVRDVCAQMRARVRQLARHLHPARDTGHMQLPDISVMRHGKEKPMTTKPQINAGCRCPQCRYDAWLDAEVAREIEWLNQRREELK